jgi:hypothetical protein
METSSSVGVRQRFPHQESPNGVAKRKRRKSRIIDEPIPKETWLERKVPHLLSLVFEETAEGKRAMVLALYLAVGPPFALAMLWDLDFYLLDRGFLAVIVLISSGAWTMFQSKEAADGSLVSLCSWDCTHHRLWSCIYASLFTRPVARFGVWRRFTGTTCLEL